MVIIYSLVRNVAQSASYRQSSKYKNLPHQQVFCIFCDLVSRYFSPIATINIHIPAKWYVNYKIDEFINKKKVIR